VVNCVIYDKVVLAVNLYCVKTCNNLLLVKGKNIEVCNLLLRYAVLLFID